MDPSAFAQARRYLDYHPVAKWSALLAATGTALLFVALLLVLSLFVGKEERHGLRREPKR